MLLGFKMKRLKAKTVPLSVDKVFFMLHNLKNQELYKEMFILKLCMNFLRLAVRKVPETQLFQALRRVW